MSKAFVYGYYKGYRDLDFHEPDDITEAQKQTIDNIGRGHYTIEIAEDGSVKVSIDEVD